MNYFNKIPTVIYNGQVAKNLLARANLSTQTRATKTAFYPYTLEDNDRIDTLSQNYYDNPGYTWLIWMTNNAVDPYYSFSLPEDDFTNYLAKKYGSVERSLRMIQHFRTRYNEDQITVVQYETMPSNFKKYYDPVLNSNLAVIAYKRKKDQDIVNTNMVVSLEFSTVNGNFTVGEEIQVDGTHYATVTAVNGNSLTCQHVIGGFQVGDYVIGKDSGVIGTISTVTTISQTLAQTESQYWEPVSVYDYERELNDSKKQIQLLDVRYKGQAEAELKRVMSIS